VIERKNLAIDTTAAKHLQVLPGNTNVFMLYPSFMVSVVGGGQVFPEVERLVVGLAFLQVMRKLLRRRTKL
jgi:hypothetical protein